MSESSYYSNESEDNDNKQPDIVHEISKIDFEENSIEKIRNENSVEKKDVNLQR